MPVAIYSRPPRHTWARPSKPLFASSNRVCSRVQRRKRPARSYSATKPSFRRLTALCGIDWSRSRHPPQPKSSHTHVASSEFHAAPPASLCDPERPEGSVGQRRPLSVGDTPVSSIGRGQSGVSPTLIPRNSNRALLEFRAIAAANVSELLRPRYKPSFAALPFFVRC